MIKLICFIRKRAELDIPAFQNHWRENHGPLIRSLPKLRRHLIRYEQNHRLAEDYARDEASGAGQGTETGAYDGSTIMWFPSMEAYHAFAAEPDYAEHIAPDEARFMDRAKTLFFFTDEEDIKLGDADRQAQAGVKLLALLRRRSDLTPEAFHAHWTGPHAALFTETPALRDHILAYQQNHRFPADYERDPETHWDGLAEQWYASLEKFYAGAGGGPFEEIVAPDEERFIDRPATQFILSHPPEIIVS
ncbi:MAG: EthD domain-containing protein [Myxococcota bacterium]